MNAIEIVAISIGTLLMLFAIGPKFIALCGILAETFVYTTVEWFVDTVGSWKELFKHWFNKK